MLKHWMLNARSGFKPINSCCFIHCILIRTYVILTSNIWWGLNGWRFTCSIWSGDRIKTVRTSAGGHGRDWFTRDGTASELSRRRFFRNKILRPEVSWNKGWMFAWAACLYIIYVRVYCKQRICMLNSPGFLFPLPTWMWRCMMFWVGYNNLFMEPIFGPLTNDAWIPRWMAVTYFCTNGNLALNREKQVLPKKDTVSNPFCKLTIRHGREPFFPRQIQSKWLIVHCYVSLVKCFLPLISTYPLWKRRNIYKPPILAQFQNFTLADAGSNH